MSKNRSFSVPIALLAAGALFLEILDGTILSVAVPAIAQDFGVNPVDISIALIAYLAAAAAGIPAAGWLGDRFGVRIVLLSALAIFTAGSLLCALAPGLVMLTVARIIQGLGGALLVPVGRLAVIRTTKPEDLLDAIAFLTWPALIAPVVAPVLGGVISDNFGWRWIFLLNIPLGIVALIVGFIILPRGTDIPSRPFDLPGFIGVALVTVALTIAAELIARGTPTALVMAAVLAICAVVIATLVVRWLRAPGRLFDLSVMTIATFRVGNISGSVYRLVITAAPFMFTLLFQVEFGWSATTAGGIVVALFAGNIAIKPFTSAIIRQWSFRPVLLFANASGALILAAFFFVDAETPRILILLLLFISGALRSLGFSAYNTLQFADISGAQTSNANVLSATLQQLGMSLGIAVAAICMSIASSPQWSFPLAALLFVFPLAGAYLLPQSGGARALHPTS
ncbi:MFS transporter [Corynebacterium callunae]|uniref:MFS transporter n=1 Tax=Corynebacterium callunae TaxID=1721 RepID=UPI00398223D9